MSEWQIIALLIAVVALVQERRFTRLQKDLDRIRMTTNNLYHMELNKL